VKVCLQGHNWFAPRLTGVLDRATRATRCQTVNCVDDRHLGTDHLAASIARCGNGAKEPVPIVQVQCFDLGAFQQIKSLSPPRCIELACLKILAPQYGVHVL
jgi:hypothetical protein